MWVVRGSLLLGIIFLHGEEKRGEMTIDTPQEITAAWESRVLGVRHGIVDLVEAVQEMTEGLIDPYFGKEFLDRMRESIQKDSSGEYTEHWENGALKARLPYKNGKPDGHLHGWYDNGRDAFKGFFKEGVKQGTHITFYWTEPDDHAKQARRLRYNESGKLDNKQATFHLNGGLWRCIAYENGQVNGPLEAWDSKGKEIISVDYKNGVLKKTPPPPPGQRKRPKIEIDEKYVHEIVREFEREVFKEFGISASGSGGSMPFDVETVSVQFRVIRRVGVEEARKLIVTLKEKLADKVNRHEKLRPYLREYPFSPLRADIFISFYQKDGGHYRDAVSYTHLTLPTILRV